MKRVYSVTEITQIVRETLYFNPLLQGVWVGGEVTDLNLYPSGHIYFALRDKDAAVKAVFFGGMEKCGGHPPEEGKRIEAFGRIDVYAKRGLYQLYVEQISRAKERGDLAEEFLKIKAQLEKEGVLARRRKPLPLLPQRIGIVTSPQAAALRDVLRVGWKRYRGARFLLSPAVVQGDETAPSVIRAIENLNRQGGCDVIIVTRGGGSLEELWGFNDIGVARAIAASRVPVVTGIGHEVDTTIADLVADAVAPTPSGAAERAIPEAAALESGLRQEHRRLGRGLVHRLNLGATRLRALAQRPVLRSPGVLLRDRAQRLDEALTALGDRAHNALKVRRIHLDKWFRLLGNLSPYRVLARGYAIVETAEGKIIKSVSGVRPGHMLGVRLSDGRLATEVKKVTPEGEPA